MAFGGWTSTTYDAASKISVSYNSFFSSLYLLLSLSCAFYYSYIRARTASIARHSRLPLHVTLWSESRHVGPIRQRHRGEADDVQQNLLREVTQRQRRGTLLVASLSLASEVSGGALHECPGSFPEGDRKVLVRLRRPRDGAAEPQHPVGCAHEDEVARRRSRSADPRGRSPRGRRWRRRTRRGDDAEPGDVLAADPRPNRLHELSLIVVGAP